MPSAAALLEQRETAMQALKLARGAALAEKFKPLGKCEKAFAPLFAALPAHAVHEIVPARGGQAPAAAGFVAALAATWAKGPIIWAREAAIAAEEGEFYAPGLRDFGLDLSRMIIIDAKKRTDALWATEEALKLPGAVAIAEIGPNGPALDLVVTRRLSLSAAEHNSTALVLSHLRERGPSAAWSRWAIGAAPSSAPGRELGAPRFAADLTRLRNAIGERRWTLEWNADAKRFTELPPA